MKIDGADAESLPTDLPGTSGAITATPVIKRSGSLKCSSFDDTCVCQCEIPSRKSKGFTKTRGERSLTELKQKASDDPDLKNINEEIVFIAKTSCFVQINDLILMTN